MKLSELPGFRVTNGELTHSYASELLAVQAAGSEEALFGHVRRWSALWEVGRNRITETERTCLDQIVGCRFDASEALECIEQLREGVCKHIKASARESCPGVNIALPSVLIMSEIVAQKFGTPVCAALHQLFCSDGNHSGCF